MNGFELRQIIGRNELTSTALKSALSEYKGLRTKVHQLIRKKVLIPLKKGYYVFGTSYRTAPLIRESIAMELYGPSAISMEYALSHYGLIPERVHTITCITPKRDKRFDTPIGTFSYRRLPSAKYGVALNLTSFGENRSALIASPTKALCDQIMLSPRLRFSSQSDLKDYLKEDLRLNMRRMRKLTNHSELAKIAKVYKHGNVDLLQKLLGKK